MAESIGRPRLLVIGNGPTGIASDGAVHVDRSGGQFLEGLAPDAAVTFAQPIEPVAASLNYFGHVLDTTRVQPLLLDRRSLRGTIRGAAALLGAIARADLVYLFYPGTLPRLVARLCRLVGKPYAIFLRGSQIDQAADEPILRQADFVLCVSEALARQTAPLNSQVAVVRSAQDLRADDAVQRDEAEWAVRPLNLLYVGRIDEEKGVPELIEAARLLHRSGLQFRLTLVGFGRLSTDLQRAASAGPDRPVTFTGAIDDRNRMLQLFREAHIFVLPSHHEGFARVLYEAMLASCAVVTTMVGGIPAVMTDEENCLAIPVGNAEAIAQSIRRLADDPALAASLARCGHQTVLATIGAVPTHLDAFRARWRAAGGQHRTITG